MGHLSAAAASACTAYCIALVCMHAAHVFWSEWTGSSSEDRPYARIWERPDPDPWLLHCFLALRRQAFSFNIDYLSLVSASSISSHLRKKEFIPLHHHMEPAECMISCK
jgi:hypothetical protein